MDQRFILMAVAWWVYGAVGTFVLGTQTGGSPLTWGIAGVLLGPIGMFGALLVPALYGRFPKTNRARILVTALTVGFLFVSELMLRTMGFGSAFAAVLRRHA